MSEGRIFYCRGQGRASAQRFIAEAPEGWRITVGPPPKSRPQERRYHAMIGDIADQATYIGRKWDAESMKRIALDEFADAMRSLGKPLKQDGEARLIPSEDGRRVIQLGIQSRNLESYEASYFIEFLYAFGSERGVVWSEQEKREVADVGG